jgi:hypothetical protein
VTKNHPRIRSVNRTLGFYPGLGRTIFSVAELPAGADLTTDRGPEIHFACAGRGADPAPDSGPGAGRLVAGSIEPPGSGVSNFLALRLPGLAQGGGSCGRLTSLLWQSRLGAHRTGQWVVRLTL